MANMFYNGVELSTIDIQASYPYTILIFKNGEYISVHTNDIMYAYLDGTLIANCKYTAKLYSKETNSWSAYTFPYTTSPFSIADFDLIWSNYDIWYEDESVYFKGTRAVQSFKLAQPAKEHIAQSEVLIAIADAIRERTNRQKPLKLNEMPAEISSIADSLSSKSITFSKTNNVLVGNIEYDNAIIESSTMYDDVIMRSIIVLDDNNIPVSIVGGDDDMVIDIEYNNSGYVDSVIVNGVVKPISWEGFD